MTIETNRSANLHTISMKFDWKPRVRWRRDARLVIGGLLISALCVSRLFCNGNILSLHSLPPHFGRASTIFGGNGKKIRAVRNGCEPPIKGRRFWHFADVIGSPFRRRKKSCHAIIGRRFFVAQVSGPMETLLAVVALCDDWTLHFFVFFVVGR